jgi:predicted enzyme related to lactoylglutathione lyase
VGKRTSYAPGTFSWVDVVTTETAAAKSFYRGLFGWEMDDEDTGAGAVYTMCRIDGDAVCGLFEMSDDMRADGVPSNWTSYVSVTDAEAAAGRADELGGAVVRQPFDVPGAGRVAVLKDPFGAVFAVWQPGARIGAERVNEIGCLCMNELATIDPEGARSFYERLFGWTTEVIDTGPDGPPMVFAHVDGRLNASFSPPAEGEVPPHWRPYFAIESTDAAVERVSELGGKVLLGPTAHPHGSIAVALDQQGARFALYAGELDP